MASKVYTKKGDKGLTSLNSNIRLSKADKRIEAIGTVDELNCHVGMLRALIKSSDMIITDLEKVQNDLFVIGSKLAAEPIIIDNKGNLLDINLYTKLMEECMDRMSNKLKPLKNFILPAGNQLICSCHIARTVTRRAERSLVKLNKHEIVHPDILIYINRLSDYFFVLARYFSFIMDEPEVIWVGN